MRNYPSVSWFSVTRDKGPKGGIHESPEFYTLDGAIGYARAMTWGVSVVEERTTTTKVVWSQPAQEPIA